MTLFRRLFTRLRRLFTRRRKSDPRPATQKVTDRLTAELLAAVQRELARMLAPDPMPPPPFSTLVPEGLVPKVEIPPLPQIQIPALVPAGRGTATPPACASTHGDPL